MQRGKLKTFFCLNNNYACYFQMAENQGFTFDELNLSLKQNNDNDRDPLTWLQGIWQDLIGKFISMAGQSAEEPVYGDVSTSTSIK